MTDIAKNLARVHERIEAAAKRAGRKAEEVRLVAVTKTVAAENIILAIQAGVKILGENYVQEAKKKIEDLGGQVAWHFIGHLQTNKAKMAARLFNLIHSVDRLDLVRELNKAGEQQGKIMPVLLQVNLSGETTKYGASEEEIFRLAEEVAALKAVVVEGLMTMPPYFENPEDSRPYFARLRKLGELLQRQKIQGIQMKELSMGMSSDFEVAIEEGATLIRVGTAIFGPRSYK